MIQVGRDISSIISGLQDRPIFFSGKSIKTVMEDSSDKMSVSACAKVCVCTGNEQSGWVECVTGCQRVHSPPPPSGV